MKCRTLLLVSILALSAAAAFPADFEAPGVSNFHKVDDRVYRGGQPTSEGLVNLSKLGIKTVIDLRLVDGSSQVEKKVAEGLGMQYVSVPMKGLATPTDAAIAKVLSLLESESAAPVFVHCLRGKDRTGTVVACYRVQHDHWQNRQALKEAKSHGMSRLEIGMQHYILRYTPAVAPGQLAQK
jgi:tyrosine-protein phosphatase SIW14